MRPNISSNFMSASLPNIVHLTCDGTSLTKTPQPEINVCLLGFEHLPFSLTDAERQEHREEMLRPRERRALIGHPASFIVGSCAPHSRAARKSDEQRNVVHISRDKTKVARGRYAAVCDREGAQAREHTATQLSFRAKRAVETFTVARAPCCDAISPTEAVKNWSSCAKRQHSRMLGSRISLGGTDKPVKSVPH